MWRTHVALLQALSQAYTRGQASGVVSRLRRRAQRRGVPRASRQHTRGLDMCAAFERGAGQAPVYTKGALIRG